MEELEKPAATCWLFPKHPTMRKLPLFPTMIRTFMNNHELRDLDQARRFLSQGICLQRAVPASTAAVKPALQWALEIASSGRPLPPVGFVADVAHAAFGQGTTAKVDCPALETTGLPTGLARTYEDYVLGKFYADWTFERGADAVRHYEGRDRARGLAFIVQQFLERAGIGGVELSPAVIKGLLETPPEEVLARGWESLTNDGLMPILLELYESLIAASRRTAEVLGPEDVFELEHGTALSDLGQRVALRQVLQASARLESCLPRHRVRPLPHRHEVPTRILDEDTYPVGGFSSISTRGTIESLLHSQLAFMEQDDRPDLFDVKYLRDELLYYSRDENQFLRRRRTFLFALHADLVQARYKDAELPWQRGILTLALMVSVVRKLSEWLSVDALAFEFLFPSEKSVSLLDEEFDLLQMVLREPIACGTVILDRIPEKEWIRRCEARARRSLCHCLTVSVADRPFEADSTTITRLRIDGPCPSLAMGKNEMLRPEGDDCVERWGAALEKVLEGWV